MKNGPGRSNTLGERVEKCKGFLPNSFDRVLLDAPCSALGLRPRLFAGEVWHCPEFYFCSQANWRPFCLGFIGDCQSSVIYDLSI